MTDNRRPSPLRRLYKGPLVRKGERGLSLVELMVSMAIGLIIVSAMGYIFLGSSRVFRSLEASSRIQENIRYAFERISHDVRMAGYAGCSYSTQANVLNGSANWSRNLFARSIQGFSAGSALPGDITGVARGDVLTVLEADNSGEYIVDSHNPASAQFQLTVNHDFKQGEILVVTDCVHAAVFQMTNVNNNNTIKTVNHNTGNATSPGNCTKGFGLPVDCTNVNGVAYTFPLGSRLLRLSSAAYYVGVNAKGENALFRRRLSQASGNAVTVAEELVGGVEDMRVTYGVDTSATADGAVDTYTDASQVTVVAPGADDDAKWARVLAVRVALLAVSKSSQDVAISPQSVAFAGNVVTHNDRRLRKAFTTTIAVRNRQ